MIALSDKLLMGSEHGTMFKGELIMLLTALIGAIYAIFSQRILRIVPASTMDVYVFYLLRLIVELIFMYWHYHHSKYG